MKLRDRVAARLQKDQARQVVIADGVKGVDVGIGRILIDAGDQVLRGRVDVDGGR